ncbi:cupin domain-containing protein [Candidatus Hydrogenedentota bacterium]
MKHGHIDNVPAVEVSLPKADKTTMQWLVSNDIGAGNFFMRQVVVKPGGIVNMHDHAEEHEIFVFKGQGAAFTELEEVDIRPGSFLFVPADERHGFRNTGDGPLALVCCINNIAK